MTIRPDAFFGLFNATELENRQAARFRGRHSIAPFLASGHVDECLEFVIQALLSPVPIENPAQRQQDESSDSQPSFKSDGKMINRPRPVAGMIFFNDEGDEVGGLTYTGQDRGGVRNADAGIMFDQLKQDQTIGFSYTESNGRRMAGFQVWDRPESGLSELIEKLNAANAIADRAERDKALAAIRAAAHLCRQKRRPRGARLAG